MLATQVLKLTGRLTGFGLGCALALTVSVNASIRIQQEPSKNPSPDVTRQSPAITDADQLRKTVAELRAEVARFKKRIAELEKDRQVDSTQLRLGKEEQQAETLHAQLLSTMEKEASLKARMDQITTDLRPESIDNWPVGGSLHPEEARENARRRLTNEKHRVQSQLDLLSQDHTRLQSSLADSDAAIQRLRLRLSATAP